MSDEQDKTEEEQLEEALEPTPASETLPPGDDETAIVEPTDPAPADPEPPVEPPEAEAKAAPATRKPRTTAQKAKRKADAERRKAAIAMSPRAPDPSQEDEAEQKRKADLRDKMAGIQDEIDDLEAAAQAKKEELQATSSELYLHLKKSDRHVDAVKGYIASQKNLRATRQANPARIKAILEAAGKSPIDNAFSAQRARGMKRPDRPAAAQAPANGDAAPGATPASSGSE